MLFFPSPRSVTGEAVLELHVHGGPAIVRAVLRALSQRTSHKTPVRPAEPGEFSRRAFLNGRLGLTQAEALGAALAADTERQRRRAVGGAAGALAARYESWRAALLRARAELEALIDFHEDQHLDESPAELAASVARQVAGLRALIDAHARNAVRGELLRGGIGIALLGEPNAGKSSLLNRIVGREAAIVSEEAGTTRDVVEVGLDIGGYFCRLGDMAGLRSGGNGNGAIKQSDQSLSSDEVGKVEEEGIRRAKQRALESDLVIVVLNVELDNDGKPTLLLPPDVVETANDCDGKIVVVMNKIDLIETEDRTNILQEWKATLFEIFENVTADHIFPISCKLASEPPSSMLADSDPGNIQAFLSGLISAFQLMTDPLTTNTAEDASLFEESLGASERHRLLLEQCRDNLEAFLGQVQAPESISEDIDIVVAAESLREAADCLARITGRGTAGDVEEVLGVVFEKYVILAKSRKANANANATKLTRPFAPDSASANNCLLADPAAIPTTIQIHDEDRYRFATSVDEGGGTRTFPSQKSNKQFEKQKTEKTKRWNPTLRHPSRTPCLNATDTKQLFLVVHVRRHGDM